MANTIKHKRGSGSNPSASDLVAGEIAIRTDTGVLFTKKDDNSVVSISGGSTDLGVTTTSTAVTVTSSSGNNATISEASGSAAGVMSVAHHDKLDGIEANATADQTKSDIDALGINAATLDSIDSSSFLRSDANDTASGNITFSSTGHIKVPVGTTAQRPTAVQGMIRFNTTRGCFEGYTGSNWVNMSPLNIDDVGAT